VVLLMMMMEGPWTAPCGVGSGTTQAAERLETTFDRIESP
jgi:hypothetical protein